MAEHIGPMADYLAKLLARMRETKWLPNDPLYADVKQADEAMRDLRARLEREAPDRAACG